MRQVCPNGSIPYMIQSGDTLAQIAKLYQVRIPDLIAYNPYVLPNNLQVGTIICIPPSIQLYPTCITTNYYVVSENDTIESIANYFNVSVDELSLNNYGINLKELYKDQILCIPVSKPPVEIIINSSDQVLYVFQNGNILKTYTLYNTLNVNGSYQILNKQIDNVEFGPRYLGLSEPNLGIQGIGNNPSHFQLLDEDMAELFNLVSVGTNVLVI